MAWMAAAVASVNPTARAISAPRSHRTRYSSRTLAVPCHARRHTRRAHEAQGRVGVSTTRMFVVWTDSVRQSCSHA